MFISANFPATPVYRERQQIKNYFKLIHIKYIGLIARYTERKYLQQRAEVRVRFAVLGKPNK